MSVLAASDTLTPKQFADFSEFIARNLGIKMPPTKQVMLQAVIIGLALAFLGMVAAAFNLIPVVVGAFLQEAIDVVSILWALTALLERDWVVER